MNEPSYEKVRFIGYAIPTTPAQLVDIGDPDGSGMLAGSYLASEDFATDIHARVAVLKAAIDTARDAVADAADPTVLNVFVAPEFFWHGVMGPYVHRPADVDPVDAILALLRQELPVADYPHFLFVLGTVVTAEIADVDAVLAASSTVVRNDVVRTLGEAWIASAGPLTDVTIDLLVNFIRSCHAYPVVEVRNRALVLSAAPLSGALGDEAAAGTGRGSADFAAITTEKYFDSNEDFLLWDVTGRPIITEQMTAYPVIDPSGGDLKTSVFDPYSIFGITGADHAAAPVHVAVEICLDHSDHRLRRSVGRNRWPNPSDGIDIHVIPSCGMQLHPPSIAARGGGWAFNCDGEYPLGDDVAAGIPQHRVVGGVDGVYVDYAHASGAGAHTQLALVRSGALQSNPRASGAADAVFAAIPDISVAVIPVAATASLDGHFAGGAGALHVYGMHTPLPLRA